MYQLFLAFICTNNVKGLFNSLFKVKVFNIFPSLTYTVMQYCTAFFVMSVWFSNTLPNYKYSNLLIVAAFFNDPFSRKISPPDNSLYLPIFSDDKSKILVVYLSKLY